MRTRIARQLRPTVDVHLRAWPRKKSRPRLPGAAIFMADRFQETSNEKPEATGSRREGSKGDSRGWRGKYESARTRSNGAEMRAAPFRNILFTQRRMTSRNESARRGDDAPRGRRSQLAFVARRSPLAARFFLRLSLIRSAGTYLFFLPSVPIVRSTLEPGPSSACGENATLD